MSPVRAIRDLFVRLRRAAWRQSVESILMNEHGWSLEESMNYADLMEDVADRLIEEGRLERFPTPRQAIGRHGGSLA